MDKGGRIVGMLVFLMGIAILLFVFLMAYRMFGLPVSTYFPAGAQTSALGASILWLLIRIMLLFVMSLAASIIASRGVNLYLGSAEKEKV